MKTGLIKLDRAGGNELTASSTQADSPPAVEVERPSLPPPASDEPALPLLLTLMNPSAVDVVQRPPRPARTVRSNSWKPADYEGSGVSAWFVQLEERCRVGARQKGSQLNLREDESRSQASKRASKQSGNKEDGEQELVAGKLAVTNGQLRKRGRMDLGG